MRLALAFIVAISFAVPAFAGKPLPPSAQLDAAKRLVAETFAAELSAADKAPAVKTMLDAAESTTGDDPAQAALYLSAAEAAARSGDTRAAFDAIGRLARAFDVDELATKGSILEMAADAAKSNEARVSIANRGLELADAAVSAGRFDLAESALKTAAAASAKVRDASLRKEIAAKRKSVEKACKQAEHVEAEIAAARKKLESDPSNPAANESLGKHLAFDRNDWQAGLKHLVKAADSQLRAVAVVDAESPGEADAMAKAGDLWWALADDAGAKSTRDRAGYRSRAVFWYTRAAGQLKGFAKTRVEKRIAEAGEEALTTAASQNGGENGKFIDVTLAPGVVMRLVKIPASKDGKIKEFWLGQTEVTQRQWTAVMGSNPSAHLGDMLPVEMVTWNDCREFLNQIQSSSSGRRLRFRFPTPTEFRNCYEPIAKEQQSGPMLCKIAWVKANAGDMTHAVASLEPTGILFYDVLGNVCEWSSNEDEVYGCAFSDAAPGGFFASGAKTYNKGSNLGLRVAADTK